MFNAGCSACGCCTIGFVIVAVVFSVLVLPEYQLINSFQQDSCMMYDCGGEQRCIRLFDNRLPYFNSVIHLFSVRFYRVLILL